MRALTILTSLSLAATQALGDIKVRFDEGAPKDRFTITRTGSCDLGAAQVIVDLSTSPHGLIFDVAGSGKGVEVFQPFQLVAGTQFLTSEPSVEDGDQEITLPLSTLAKGQSVAFTIDVDDTGGGREITVSGAEIAGAIVSVSTASKQYTGTFDASSNAVVQMDDCAS